jgi:hypothetical protein
MPEYDFKSLSSYDFALLTRDLLQSQLGVPLETFSPGPDSGIDFRYQTKTIKLVVQSKHYAGSGFAALLSVLRRKERPKIETLAPTRYILLTSVSLTPKRKEQINKILTPYCVVPSDIFGREDLNNLLGQHDEIERKHFKLWLTSETVLRRALDSGIFADSEAHLERVRLRLCRYVQNPSFDRARLLLEKSHYCIIAGIPGIGKTTLAEVLLADLVDRHAFEAFRVAHDLSEIRSVKNSKRKQVFYFDDFLGRTALANLQKNEDQRLVELMEEVASNSNWRFILTTREYILNSAKLLYEAFAHPPIDFMPCIVNLADYTRPIRARILYNHIYFSGLPTAHKLALLENKGYESILRHRNYSPRVIEYMTQTSHAGSIPASLYLPEFVDSLDHPTRIWDHAFRHQISEAARHLLLVLTTLPDDPLLDDVEKAFWAFYRFRQSRFGFATRSSDWNDALRQLDGNFINTRKLGKDLVVAFHNPSIRDFVEDFLSSSESDVADLISSAHFYEQYVTLWEGGGDQRYAGVDRNQEKFLQSLKKNFFGPSASAIRVVHRGHSPIGVDHNPPSYERRAEFALRIANDFNNATANQFLNELITSLRQLWEKGQADKEDLVSLLAALTQRGMSRGDDSFKSAKRCLSTKYETIDEFRAIAEFAKTYTGEIAASELENVKTQFMQFANDYSSGWGDEEDPDWLRQIAANLEFVGERLRLDVTQFTDPLYEGADEVEKVRADREPDADDRDGGDFRSSYADDVDAMFHSLRDELTG